jgi:ADP-heptose:LPS heptosyltransferase
LLAVADATFYSLQIGPATSQLKDLPAGLNLIDLASEQQDFADTAAIVANLDLIISIDTSVAHLAGAMGKPVWILLHHMPDWRWQLHRSDSPWYPTARLFRQSKPGMWDDVLDQVGRELKLLAEPGPAPQTSAGTTEKND